MKPFLIIFLSFIANIGFAQDYINSTKEKAKTNFNAYATKNNYQSITKESDSTLVFLLVDSTIQSMSTTLYFNENGKCIKDVRVFNCDSCFRKAFNYISNNKYYHWKKVEENKLVSIWVRKIELTKNEETHSYTIEKGKLKRREYLDLLRLSKE